MSGAIFRTIFPAPYHEVNVSNRPNNACSIDMSLYNHIDESG